MKVEDVLVGSPEAAAGALARLVRAEGVDLLAARADELARGTPVYVDAGADVLAVQRRMAECHVRRVLVVRDEDVVGIVDLLDLALSDACAPAPSDACAPVAPAPEAAPSAPAAARALRPLPQPGA